MVPSYWAAPMSLIEDFRDPTYYGQAAQNYCITLFINC